MLKRIEYEQFKTEIKHRDISERLNYSDCLFVGMDFTGWNLRNINFDRSDFRKCTFDQADLTGCSAENAFFQTSTLNGTILRDCNLKTADFRFCKMQNVDISGADIFCAALHAADLTGLIADEKTKHYYPTVTMDGAFIGWKVCFGRRIVQLLVPKDARRLQGTNYEVRVDKAFVLSVRSVDYQTDYEDAHSYVDENFVYRSHEWVTVEEYDTDRFTESGGGIHVWLDRESAIAYLG